MAAAALPDAHRFWRYLRGLLPPLLLFCLLLGALVYTLQTRLRGEEQYDEAILEEWVQEARVFRATLPELVRRLIAEPQPLTEDEITERRAGLQAHLSALGDLTKTYQTQLPLFPTIYSMEVEFTPATQPPLRWESQLSTGAGPRRRLRIPLYAQAGLRSDLLLDCQLHAYAQRQEEIAARLRQIRIWLGYLAALGAIIAILWVLLFLRGETEQHQAQHKLDLSRQQALQEQLKRQEAEHQKDESQRALLEQRLATQEAERQALNLKSQIYANIGVMAGSYAHNIKNMMVRPVDLLQRVQEREPPHSERVVWLEEVRQSLTAIAERTQQILRTVHRDPTQVQLEPCDLNDLVNEAARTWSDLALHKWKVRLVTRLAVPPLPISADRSQLQQALENVIFNSRDAIFESRARLREVARQQPLALQPDSLLAAANWQGEVVLETRNESSEAVLRISDNGNGMTPETAARCMETYFSTKRGSALHEGNSTGLGLGLPFVKTMVEQHQGSLTLQTQLGSGTVIEIRLPKRAE